MTKDETSTTFTYNALGQRLSRTVDGTTSGYVWNNALALPSVSIETQNGEDLRYFVHTPNGELLYRIDADTDARNFSHFDEMGNTIFVTGDDGAVIGSYAYSPYGQPIASTGSLDNPFTWQGQYGVMDEGNGLYYMRARYYDSATKRFISRDPVKSINPKEINPYQYAVANPLRFVDPWGAYSAEEVDAAIAVHRALYEAHRVAMAAHLAAYKAHSTARAAHFAAAKAHWIALEPHMEALSWVDMADRTIAEIKAAKAAESARRDFDAQEAIAGWFTPGESKREANGLHMPKGLLLQPFEHQLEWIIKSMWDQLGIPLDGPESVVPELVGIVVLT